MCKILVFTNGSKLSTKTASETIGNVLLKTETDGFGYAIKGESGVFGEKCIAPRFKSRIGIGGQIAKKDPAVPFKPRYEIFGAPSKPAGPAIFHGRVSTNYEGLVNTHPMHLSDAYVKGQLGIPVTDADSGVWTLIHNGVVGDHGKPYQKLTQNDSEDLLFRMIESQIKAAGTSIFGLESVETELTGYYAFAAIDPAGRLHIVRDHIADLFVAWSNDLDSYIYGTTESLISDVAKKLKFKIGPIEQVEDESYIVFEGNTVLHTQWFRSRGPEKKEAQHSVASLGKVVDASKGLYSWPNEGELFPYANDSSRFNDDGGAWSSYKRDETKDDAYAIYLEELEHLDDTYEILDENDNAITIQEFMHKDSINREMCTVIREDGTIVGKDVPTVRGVV